MKNIYILLIFICSMANVQAQNSELAKAFYTKAEAAYKANNYEEALQLIEKCKEQLNGETNPDILYIEAKARFFGNKEPRFTKVLMNKFIEEAFEDDERVKEIAGLLVDLEMALERESVNMQERQVSISAMNKLEIETIKRQLIGKKSESWNFDSYSEYVDERIISRKFIDKNNWIIEMEFLVQGYRTGNKWYLKSEIHYSFYNNIESIKKIVAKSYYQTKKSVRSL